MDGPLLRSDKSALTSAWMDRRTSWKQASDFTNAFLGIRELTTQILMGNDKEAHLVSQNCKGIYQGFFFTCLSCLLYVARTPNVLFRTHHCVLLCLEDAAVEEALGI